jgi:hypothetical protein
MMSPAQVAAWNVAHPVGTLVEVRPAVAVPLYLARTAKPLTLWGACELLELVEGHCVTLDRVRVVGSELSDARAGPAPMP